MREQGTGARRHGVTTLAFSYSLFLVLLLIFPGLCFWAGWRAGERTDFLSPSPDRPNSTVTLFMIVLGTIGGHMLGTGIFALQAAWCRSTALCFDVGFDPNVYRSLLRGATGAQGASDLALELWLAAMLLIGIATGVVAYWLVQREAISGRTDPIAFGWLNPAVQAVKKGDSFVVAYVFTKTNHDAFTVAYEGTVQQLALDEDQSIKFVVLNDVDRFLVKISDKGLERVDAPSTPITQLQITAAEIANVALEVLRAPELDVAAVDAEDASA